MTEAAYSIFIIWLELSLFFVAVFMLFVWVPLELEDWIFPSKLMHLNCLFIPIKPSLRSVFFHSIQNNQFRDPTLSSLISIAQLYPLFETCEDYLQSLNSLPPPI